MMINCHDCIVGGVCTNPCPQYVPKEDFLKTNIEYLRAMNYVDNLKLLHNLPMHHIVLGETNLVTIHIYGDSIFICEGEEKLYKVIDKIIKVITRTSLK